MYTQGIIHHYYLQVTAEQGFPGLIIWVSLIIWVLLLAQNLYKKATDKMGKNFVMAIALSFITILVNIALSDLIEADKIGTMFLMLIAMLVNMSIYLRNKKPM